MNYTNTLLTWLREWYVWVAMLIIVSAIGIKIHNNMLPEASAIPGAVMPTPNARDTFNAAETLAKDSDKIGYAIEKPRTGPAPEGENVNDYKSAWHVFSLADKEQLVDENKPALDQLHQGLSEQYMNPPARSFEALFPYFAKDRGMARLLSLESQVDSAKQDWDGAATSGIDSIQLGSQIQHGSPMIGMLVGVACESIGRKAISNQGVLNHLSADEAKFDALRLAQITENENPYSQALQEDAWCGEAGLLQIFHTEDWRKELGSLGGQPAWNSSLVDLLRTNLTLSLVSPRDSYNRYKTYMDSIVAYSKLPWPAQLSTPEPKVPTSDPICAVLCPVFSQADFKYCANLTLDRLMETQFALRAYDLDHHGYPSSLDQLVPEYLPSVPLDPFSNNSTLNYHLNGNSYLLYSIGQDATDNRGTPIDNTAFFTASEPYELKNQDRISDPNMDINAKGDIVAGVNE